MKCHPVSLRIAVHRVMCHQSMHGYDFVSACSTGMSYCALQDAHGRHSWLPDRDTNGDQAQSRRRTRHLRWRTDPHPWKEKQ